MCGIAGIINYDSNETFQSLNIYNMTEKIKHRGPDDEGYLLVNKNGYSLFYGDDTFEVRQKGKYSNHYFINHIRNAFEFKSYIAFGHRRLSIIDLSFAGNQPMAYLGRYWIVYNGEIYNYIEIRDELAKIGYTFKSHTDTEIILGAYDRWGTDCLKKFNGMWAFVIYDSLLNNLFISRDRFGIKPLYYYKDNDKFIFASEIKAILAHSEVNTSPNVNYCKDYLKHGPKEWIKETAFSNIFRFAHASFYEANIEKLSKTELVEQSFWNCKPNLSNEKYDEEKAINHAHNYYKLLNDSVRIRLRADVKIGAALSGGLDSSTITYLINQQLNEQSQARKQETFSSVYKSSEKVRYCDESAYIDELADFLKVNSNQIEPKTEEIINEHKKMIYAMENPAVGPNMGGWYTFKCVSSTDVKINLDGQGADEQMGGYFSYLYRYIANLPLSELQKEVSGLFKLPGINKKNIILSIFINIIKRTLPKKLTESICTWLFNNKGRISVLTHFNDALLKSTMTTLLNLIHFGDSQSMAHSIESRLPFMDYRLVEFLASVPAVYKIHNGWTKYIARIAMDEKLPEKITWRKDKMGWPDPSDYWFRGELKEWLCKEVESSIFLKQLGCKINIRKKIEGKTPIINLIRLLNLSIFYKTFFQP